MLPAPGGSPQRCATVWQARRLSGFLQEKAGSARRITPRQVLKAGPRVVWVGLHKSGFTELCSVTKRPTETPLAAATRKLNQLKDKAVAYQTRQQMLQVGRARVLGGAAATSHEGAAATSHGGARLPAKAGAANA